MLFVFITALTAVILTRNFFKKKIPDRVFRYTLGSFLLLMEVVFYIWMPTTHHNTLDYLPFFLLCSFINMLTIIGLFFNLKKMFAITFYWALTGAFYALIFFDITYTFPHFRFFQYFLSHIGFCIVHLYFYLTGRIKINKNNFLISVFILTLLSIVMLGIDRYHGKNYWFMLGCPPQLEYASDALGKLYTITWMTLAAVTVSFWYVMFKFIDHLRFQYSERKMKDGQTNQNAAERGS